MHICSLFRTLGISSALLLSACDALNCVINNHPEFSKTSLNDATLNQVYDDSIRASISNSLDDNQYNYEITLAGDLPEGLSYESTGSTITFNGTPTQLGEFPLRLTVVAEPKVDFSQNDQPEDLCSDTETRDLVLSVIQG